MNDHRENIVLINLEAFQNARNSKTAIGKPHEKTSVHFQ